MKNSQHYISRFIVDVIESSDEIVLRDSSGGEYHILKTDVDTANKFNHWFKCIFCTGKAQNASILKVKSVDISECEIELHIVDFLNLPTIDQN